MWLFKMLKMKLLQKLSVFLTFLLISIFPVACATHISTRAAKVRVVSTEQAHECEIQCKFVGNVTGDAFWMLHPDIAYNNALNEVLDHAAEVGATHVFVNYGYHRDLRGEAYFCAHCVDENGVPDSFKCIDKDGNLTHIKKEKRCVREGNQWLVPADIKEKCEAKDWFWVPNKDVLRTLPFGFTSTREDEGE
jgi:hypothetical protein